MGTCCTGERGLLIASDENEKLMSENLLVLKAIAMHYADKRMHAMSVRILHIRDITEEYYKKSSEQRKIALLDKPTFEDDDLKHLEMSLRQEHEDLVNANHTLKDFFSKARSKLVFLSVSPQEFISDFRSNEIKMNDYRELQDQCKRYRQNGKGLLSLARILNSDKDFDDRQDYIVTDLSRYTSHIACNSQRRVTFPSAPHRNGNRSTRRYHLRTMRSRTTYDETNTDSSRRNSQYR